MHSLGVFHMDLKPANIMVSEKVTVLLGDFAATLNQERFDSQYSEHFADRESGLKNFTWANDIYSFGLSMHFILTGRHLSAK